MVATFTSSLRRRPEPHQIALDAAIQGQPTPTDTLSGVFQPYRPRLMQAVRIASTRRCRPRHPRTPPTGRDAALSHRRDLLPEVSCPAGGRRRTPAAFRPAGVQATRLLSIPRRTWDGGVGRTSRRSRPAGATHPAVGADLPPPVALPVRRPAASAEPGPGRRLPCDLDLPHQKDGVHRRLRRQNRCGHPDPAVRFGASIGSSSRFATAPPTSSSTHSTSSPAWRRWSRVRD